MGAATFTTHGAFQNPAIRGSTVPNTIPVRAVDIPLVTGLPLSPEDGDIVFYRMGTKETGSLWTLRYNKFGNVKYPWDCIGGSQFESRDDSDRNITATGSYSAVPSTAISIDVPAPGSYEVDTGAELEPSGTTTSNFTTITPAGSALTASANYRLIEWGTGAANPRQFGRTHTIELTADNLTIHGFVSGGTGVVRRARLAIRPVRIGR